MSESNEVKRAQLIARLMEYIPYNEQEARDRETILRLLRSRDDIFLRLNTFAHMTASAWVVDSTRTKVLMAYHNIYNSWSWLGGHADGEADLLQVAIREVREESGVNFVEPLTEDIFSIEVLTVDGHEKRGAYVPSHLHLNITYLLEASENEETRIAEEENSGVKWFPLSEAVAASSEEWFRERIYSKLNQKLNLFLLKQRQ